MLIKQEAYRPQNLHKVKTEMLTCKRRENDSFYLKKKSDIFFKGGRNFCNLIQDLYFRDEECEIQKVEIIFPKCLSVGTRYTMN